MNKLVKLPSFGCLCSECSQLSACLDCRRPTPPKYVESLLLGKSLRVRETSQATCLTNSQYSQATHDRTMLTFWAQALSFHQVLTDFAASSTPRGPQISSPQNLLSYHYLNFVFLYGRYRQLLGREHLQAWVEQSAPPVMWYSWRGAKHNSGNNNEDIPAPALSRQASMHAHPLLMKDTI